MRNMHPYLVYDSVPYDEVSALLPVSSLPGEAVDRGVAAVDLIEATSDENVLAVAPVSTATGYMLAQEPLTAVDLDRVGATTRSTGPIDDYEVLVVGRPRRRRNHSLHEYV